ncbi:hypothetical protein [Ulvibacterium sp.]|nr:hypothetical protein [Ulvibacterium sp.]
MDNSIGNVIHAMAKTEPMLKSDDFKKHLRKGSRLNRTVQLKELNSNNT